jgi:hypothetical protein
VVTVASNVMPLRQSGWVFPAQRGGGGAAGDVAALLTTHGPPTCMCVVLPSSFSRRAPQDWWLSSNDALTRLT